MKQSVEPQDVGKVFALVDEGQVLCYEKPLWVGQDVYMYLKYKPFDSNRGISRCIRSGWHYAFELVEIGRLTQAVLGLTDKFRISDLDRSILRRMIKQWEKEVEDQL